MLHEKNLDLKNYTSFKIGGAVKNAYFPENMEEFEYLLRTLKHPLVLGGMSNVLISSLGICEDVIFTKKFNTFEINDCTVVCDAGVMGPIVSKAVAKEGLSGMEFMSGFPGSIGGVVSMNAGAHGQCIADIFKEAVLFDKETSEIVTFSKEDMSFVYRNSVINEGRYVVLKAVFELTRLGQDKIYSKINEIKEFRSSKQPNLGKPNCGSVFKNPEGNSAGRLLDDAGVKGLRVGNAKVYENHANFIINLGGATSEDVSQLMKKMYNKVNEKFRIKLTPEVRFIGEKNEVEKEIWNEFLNN